MASLKVTYADSRQQPPQHKGDVDSDGVEGEAERDRPNVAAYRANIVVAGHRCRLTLIRASSVLTVASTLVAEAATSLNLAGCRILGAVGEKILLATGMPEGYSIGAVVDSLCSVGPERSSRAIAAAASVVTAVSRKTLEYELASTASCVCR
jgi:hypothetical protein